jgi:hypothetical protein
MQDDPGAAELVQAVADFLRDDILPKLSGHSGFKMRVGINALDLVVRELTLAGQSDAAEHARLVQIMGLQGTLADLNRDFAQGIADGSIDPRAPGVAEHLWLTTMEKLAVDQPKYASYRRELEAAAEAEGGVTDRTP